MITMSSIIVDVYYVCLARSSCLYISILFSVRQLFSDAKRLLEVQSTVTKEKKINSNIDLSPEHALERREISA